MLDLWIPKNSEPQIADDACSTIVERAFDRGLLTTGIAAWEGLQTDSDELGGYILDLGISLKSPDIDTWDVIIPKDLEHRVAVQGLWSLGVLKIGAGLALSAYRETGYFHRVDSRAIETGRLFAEIGGIPEAFEISAQEDEKLVAIVNAVAACTELEAASLEPHIEKTRSALFIGAGCTRHYLQQSLELAA